MAKPLRLLVDLLTYEGTLTNDPQDAIEAKRKVEESNVSEAARTQKVIPASTVDMVLNLVDSSNDYLLLFIDQQVSIKLNGSSNPIVLNPKAPGYKTPVFVLRGVSTALTISNAGANPANVDLVSIKI